MLVFKVIKQHNTSANREDVSKQTGLLWVLLKVWLQQHRIVKYLLQSRLKITFPNSSLLISNVVKRFLLKKKDSLVLFSLWLLLYFSWLDFYVDGRTCSLVFSSLDVSRLIVKVDISKAKKIINKQSLIQTLYSFIREFIVDNTVKRYKQLQSNCVWLNNNMYPLEYVLLICCFKYLLKLLTRWPPVWQLY